MKKNPYLGKFIAFEGVEGSGKSTQAELLHRSLLERAIPHEVTKEPTSQSVFGKLVKFIYACESLYDELPDKLDACTKEHEYELVKAMLGDVAKRHLTHFEDIADEIRKRNHERLPLLLQLGMIFDRYQHRLWESERLEKGICIISDRDFFSTLAYGAAEGLSEAKLLVWHEEILGDRFIVPDCVLVFDVPVIVGLQRTMKKQGGKQEHFDEPVVMDRIRENYSRFIERPDFKESMRIEKINGLGTPKEVNWRVLRVINDYF
ncbi:MAG: hypothetical protein Q8P97_01265 [bacterium]|nr:hypothetical protein [bacterium]